ncbi:MAG: HEAT repeat domain-containing protein [Myxococcota bacterium]
MKKRWGILLLAVGGIALGLWLTKDPVRSVRPRLSAGAGYLYNVNLDSRVATNLSVSASQSASLAVHTQIQGRLQIDLSDGAEGTVVQSWRFISIDDGAVSAAGKAVSDGEDLRTRLVGPSLAVSLNRDGSVRSFHRDPASDDLFLGVMELIAAEAAFVYHTDQDSWLATERVHLGVVESRYRADANAITRARERYNSLSSLPYIPPGAVQDLTSTATIRLQEDAMPESFDSMETMRLTSASGALLTQSEQALSLSLVSQVQRLPTLGLDGRVSVPVGTPRNSPNAERAALVEQAGDLDREAFFRFLRQDRAKASGSSGNQVLWQSVALLRLHPEMIDDLVKLIGEESTTFDTRMFAFSALAGAGTPSAQAAIHRMLDTHWAYEDTVARRRLLQQLSFVAQPTMETAKFLRKELYNDNSSQRYAAAYSLGSVARKIRERGDTAIAAELTAELVSNLETATNVETRARMIAALGNAGSTEHVATLNRHAGDRDREVRAAVARALLRTPTDTARDTAVELVGDESARVQRAALATVERWQPNQELYRRVGERILDAGSPKAHIEALRLVRRIDDLELRRRVLQRMLETAQLDSRFIGELRVELEKTEPI